MDSRLSEPYNIRAAQIRMIPGGAGGIPMNAFEGGEPAWTTLPMKRIVPDADTSFCGVPTLEEIGRLRSHYVSKYETTPYAMDQTFTNTLGASKLNQQFTRVPGSYYDDKNFDIIGSEKYPEPPILWLTSIGVNSRQAGRSDGVKYKR